MQRGWTKKLYEVLSKDDEIKKRLDTKLEENGVNGKDVKLAVDVTHKEKTGKYAYLENFG